MLISLYNEFLTNSLGYLINLEQLNYYIDKGSTMLLTKLDIIYIGKMIGKILI